MSEMTNRSVNGDGKMKDHLIDRPPNFSWHMIDEVGHSFAEDRIEKATPIARWLWGKPLAKKLYHLARTSNVPIAHLGSQLVIRKSVIRAHLWAQERKAFKDGEESLAKLAILLARLSVVIRQMSAKATLPDLQLLTALTQEIGKLIDELLDGK